MGKPNLTCFVAPSSDHIGVKVYYTIDLAYQIDS